MPDWREAARTLSRRGLLTALELPLDAPICRPGPALITLPMDVQAASVELGSLPDPATRRPQGAPGGDPETIKRAVALLVQAQRPVILAGGGVLLGGAERELLQLAEHLGAAVVSTKLQPRRAWKQAEPFERSPSP